MLQRSDDFEEKHTGDVRDYLRQSAVKLKTTTTNNQSMIFTCLLSSLGFGTTCITAGLRSKNGHNFE